MRFMVLVHEDPDAVEVGLNEAERRALDEENLAYDRRLRQSGKLIEGGPLADPKTATIVRSAEGRLSMTDGPYVETKEHVAGFLLVEAADQKEAVEIVSLFPMVRFGSTIEVREHWTLEDRRER